MSNLEQIYQKIDYCFTDSSLLIQALTHRSACKENNERLEFLGDSILNFLIADLLYNQFSAAQEGKLTRIRASLVKEETLATLARELNINNYLILGPGEIKSGGYQRNSILADAFEAIIGAMYLDAGLRRCSQIVASLYENRLKSVTQEISLKDPKTRLQEYLQARQLPLPDYHLSKISGESHKRVFEVTCIADNLPTKIGIGSSRRRAEQAAATQILAQLEE
ncbi:ribonuclease III [Candidatus Nitrosacidococcus tergens]|uniref:Ribonuclease 3 n=1 Tax=Candidatus Nitrosacidococcus tergens TaxID=553981 RepID=A0A7G1QAD3_9GAMM|nr:ribonuclease III [Candidatus Nitrosacidococcus tergens]CAB1276588.1 RNase III [Candidatus Nitrosacidococcus tergens]